MGIEKLKIVWIIFLLSVGFGLYSCKTAEMTTGIVHRDMRIKDIDKIAEERNEKIKRLWVKKIKGSLWDENGQYSFKASYRIKRDSVILLSILNPMGIEGARIYCTPDSFGFVDRINREYYYGTYEVLQKKMGYKPSYKFVQSLLLNELVTISDVKNENFNEKNKKLDVKNGKYIFYYEEDVMDGYGKRTIKYEIEFDQNTFQLSRNRTFDEKNINQIDVVYTDFKEIEKTWFPGKISINIENAGNRINCQLELDRISINGDFNTSFNIGQKYKQIEW